MKKIVFFLLLFGCQPKNKFNIDDWAYYRGDNHVSHYKPYNEINIDNVHTLKKAWVFDAEDFDAENRSQIQCNPLVIDGILFGTSAKMKLFALDATNGKILWLFDPYDGDYTSHGTGVNRGLNYYRGSNGDRILYATFSNLYAIDPKNGKLINSFGNDGVVDLKKGLDRKVDNLLLAANTPGVIYDDLLILGHRASESTGAVPGHIRAFDVNSGKIKWIFHTIPYPGEYGYDTWPEDSYLKLGGANAWSGFSLDKEKGIVYVPTGSAAFDYYGGDREGSNLFANSIIALNAKNGKRIWHFQTIHHDIWDRDLPVAPNLVSITKEGKKIKALVQVTKSGYLFVFDRLSGEPLYPINEINVHSSSLDGEKSWPTQPVPTGYPPFSRINLSEDDFPIRSEEAYNYAKQIWNNSVTGNFQPLTTKGNVLFPGLDGGGEWGGAAYNPKTGISFINSNEMPWKLSMQKKLGISLGESVYSAGCMVCHGENLKGNLGVYTNIPSLENLSDRMEKLSIKDIVKNGKGIMPSFKTLSNEEINAVIEYIISPNSDLNLGANNSSSDRYSSWPYPYIFGGFNKYYAPDGYPAIKPPWGQLTAIDLNSPSILWQVPLGEHEELKKRGYSNTGTENYGGPVVTSGGILIIAATMDEKIRAFNQYTGELLWEDKLPASGYATPSTYRVNGKQYVVIACGGGKLGTKSGSSYVAYSID